MKRRATFAYGLAVLMSVTLTACERTGDAEASADSGATAEPPPAPTTPVARAIIQEPAEGAELDGKSVTIVLNVENITLAPAIDSTSGTGHHHLFINTPVVNPGEGIPAGVSNIVHLGKAQTSHELTNLTPGEYTVIAVIGDFVHRRIDPQVLDTVRFRVR